jgi:hypothetical protein
MILNATQCFFVVLLITGLIGLARGFMREVITMALVLGAVLFLLNGGDGLMHHFFFVNLPRAFHDLIYGSSAVTVGTPTVSAPNPTGDYLFGLSSFLGLMGLGYAVGHKYGSPPATYQHKVGGILPGLVNGAAISYYATQSILPSTTVDLTSPNGALTQMYLPIILGVGLVGLILVLVVSSMSKGGKGGGGGGKGH